MENSNEFSSEMKSQMKDVFEKMERPLVLKLTLDKREVSSELEAYINDIASLTDKLTVEVVNNEASSETAPCVEICYEDKSPTGLAFHGVPKDHELTSFIIGLYNASGEGQQLEESTKKRISDLKTPMDIKVLVTTACSMCPDLVIAAQHIAAKKPGVTAHIYDILHFEGMRKKYNVMSVPCLVINDSQISFGRKNIRELLAFIEK